MQRHMQLNYEKENLPPRPHSSTAPYTSTPLHDSNSDHSGYERSNSDHSGYERRQSQDSENTLVEGSHLERRDSIMSQPPSLPNIKGTQSSIAFL